MEEATRAARGGCRGGRARPSAPARRAGGGQGGGLARQAADEAERHRTAIARSAARSAASSHTPGGGDARPLTGNGAPVAQPRPRRARRRQPPRAMPAARCSPSRDPSRLLQSASRGQASTTSRSRGDDRPGRAFHGLESGVLRPRRLQGGRSSGGRLAPVMDRANLDRHREQMKDMLAGKIEFRT